MSALGKIDPARLARISEQLDADDAEWLRAQLLDRRQQAALRRAERDRLIVAALDRLAPLPATAAARSLAQIVEARSRVFDDAAPAPGSLEELAQRILALNDFRPIQWRRIHDIGIEAGASCNRAGGSLQPE